MPPSFLTVLDIEVLAGEASRQNLSLACLFAAMEDSAPIAWMGNERTIVAIREER